MDRQARLERLAAARGRIAAGLTLAVVALYFGFILLIAFAKPLLATLIAPGLSLGILLGALVIVLSWLLDLGLRALGEPALRRRARTSCASRRAAWR